MAYGVFDAELDKKVKTEGQSPRPESELLKAVKSGKITEAEANDELAMNLQSSFLASSPERQNEIAAQQQAQDIKRILQEAPLSYTVAHEEQNKEKLNEILDKIDCSLNSKSPHCVQAVDKFNQQVQTEQQQFVEDEVQKYFRSRP